MNKPADTPLPLSDARRLTQRVHFERDGTVSIATGKVELGQGISTALAQIAAEELGVELHRIRILPASTAHSPDEGVTSGSLSIQDGGKGLRKACAELRTLLRKSGRSSYWELEVAGSDIPADAPEKPPAEYRVVGTSVPRLELPAKIAGRASYVQDMTLRAMARWEEGTALPGEIYAWLKQHAAENNVAKEKADPAAKARGVKRLQAEYRKPFIAHASIGPSCALARMHGDQLAVWSHTQGIYGLRRELAMVLRLHEQHVVVHHFEGAGCYGHNGADDVALDAALLARMAKG